MKTVKMILRRLLLPALITFVVLVGLDMYSMYTEFILNKRGYESLSTAYYYGHQETYFHLLMYIIILMAFGWIYYADRKKGYIRAVSNRISRKKYRLLVWATSCAFAFFLIFLEERLAYYVTVRATENYVFPGLTTNYNLTDLMNNSPYLFSLLSSFWRAFIRSLYVSFAIVLSFYTESFFLIMSAPILYRYLIDMASFMFHIYPLGSMLYVESFESFAPNKNLFLILCINIGLFIALQIIMYKLAMKKERGEGCL